MQIEGGPRTTHGGSDNADCSGALSYVRCEFAGYPFKEDQEINAITFGSVGSATQIDHVQVSYSNDDSYEWFGGAVNAKYLVSYHTWDDDFDTDNGFCGKVQFCLAYVSPALPIPRRRTASRATTTAKALQPLLSPPVSFRT